MVSPFCLVHWDQFHPDPPVWCGDSGYIKETGHLEGGTRTWSCGKLLLSLVSPWHWKDTFPCCQTLPVPAFHLDSQEETICSQGGQLFPEVSGEIWSMGTYTGCQTMSLQVCEYHIEADVPWRLEEQGSGSSASTGPAVSAVRWWPDYHLQMSLLLPQQSTASSSNITTSVIFQSCFKNEPFCDFTVLPHGPGNTNNLLSPFFKNSVGTETLSRLSDSNESRGSFTQKSKLILFTAYNKEICFPQLPQRVV